jgi:Icc protein
MMKLIIASDFHLVAPGVDLFGSDPLQRVEALTRDINARHGDADLVIFCGDLANDCEPPAYAALAERIRDLTPPHRMMMGNHDDRAAFLHAFPHAPQQAGFIQSSIDIEGTRLVLLDTLWPENVPGVLCETRLAWLDDQLASAREALVFMHHPPFAIGIPSLDECRLTQPEELLALLQEHGNVRHIFAGHVHLPSHGSWHGIPFTTLRSTNHQSALRFTGPHAVSFEAPAYSIVLVDEQSVVVHTQEFGGSEDCS